MFGDQRPEELIPSKSFSTYVRSFQPESSNKYKVPCDGSYRRDPTLNNIALPREIGATAKVDVNGKRLDEAGTRLTAVQDSEADQARRNVDKDRTRVYPFTFANVPSSLFSRFGW